MFLGHLEAPTSHPRTPVFLLEPLRPGPLLQEHRTSSTFTLRRERLTRPLDEHGAPTISLQEYPEFLGMLNDEKFRQELMAMPVSTLARFGVHLEPGDVPRSVELPSPQNGAKITAFWAALL